MFFYKCISITSSREKEEESSCMTSKKDSYNDEERGAAQWKWSGVHTPEPKGNQRWKARTGTTKKKSMMLMTFSFLIFLLLLLLFLMTTSHDKLILSKKERKDRFLPAKIERKTTTFFIHWREEKSKKRYTRRHNDGRTQDDGETEGSHEIIIILFWIVELWKKQEVTNEVGRNRTKSLSELERMVQANKRIWSVLCDACIHAHSGVCTPPDNNEVQ